MRMRRAEPCRAERRAPTLLTLLSSHTVYGLRHNHKRQFLHGAPSSTCCTLPRVRRLPDRKFSATPTHPRASSPACSSFRPIRPPSNLGPPHTSHGQIAHAVACPFRHGPSLCHRSQAHTSPAFRVQTACTHAPLFSAPSKGCNAMLREVQKGRDCRASARGPDQARRAMRPAMQRCTEQGAHDGAPPPGGAASPREGRPFDADAASSSNVCDSIASAAAIARAVASAVYASAAATSADGPSRRFERRGLRPRGGEEGVLTAAPRPEAATRPKAAPRPRTPRPAAVPRWEAAVPRPDEGGTGRRTAAGVPAKRGGAALAAAARWPVGREAAGRLPGRGAAEVGACGCAWV